uniref:Uncharacterized protein n=1 Tax=Accipiter nisus TaxID=211598 RepID=A0A8B9M5Q4_9AVES
VGHEQDEHGSGFPVWSPFWGAVLEEEDGKGMSANTRCICLLHLQTSPPCPS